MREVDLCGIGEGVALTAIHHPKEGPLTFPAFPTPTSAGDIMLGPQPAPPPHSVPPHCLGELRAGVERLAKQASILPGMS